jgi:competence protein ComEC
VRRYREAGAQCHRTDLDGAVTFESDGHDVKVQSFLAPARPAAPPRVARESPSVQLSWDEP